MALSRSTRILLSLTIETLFFFIELIIGRAAGSLALVADSFHTLSDATSLIVTLYAIKLSSQNANDSRYSYCWHRAEILAALINGVFLLALCFSITTQALERFFSPTEISNPRLVVVVGSFGLAFNIVSLFLYHEHNHTLERKGSAPPSRPPSIHAVRNNDDDLGISRNRSMSYSSLYGHPVATRASLLQIARDFASSPPRAQFYPSHTRAQYNIARSSEETPLLGTQAEGSSGSPLITVEHVGHAHGKNGVHFSVNVRAHVLHVLGDALGNVGVIATGLAIWLTSWKYKSHFDPVISLLITSMIFSSAFPLVRSMSVILLQAVPRTISIDEVRESILNVNGVTSVHELHAWQLSESKIVASMHVTTSRGRDFMPVVVEIRKALHYHGIHSSTIQPEYHSPNPHKVPKENMKVRQAGG